MRARRAPPHGWAGTASARWLLAFGGWARWLALAFALTFHGGASAATPWTPSAPGAPALTVWFDASDTSTIGLSGGLVQSWADKSGNGNNAYSVDSSRMPAQGTLNGRSTVEFGPFYYDSNNAGGNYMTLNEQSVQTVIIVWGSQNGGGFMLADANNYDWHRGAGPGQNGGSASDAIFDSTYASGNLRSGDAEARLNGTVINPTSTGLSGDYDVVSVRTSSGNPVSFGQFTRDRHYRSGGQGIAEMVALSSRATDADIQRYEGYLAWKWGLQGKLPAGHPYKSSAPTVDIPPGATATYVRTDTTTQGSWVGTYGSDGSSVIYDNNAPPSWASGFAIPTASFYTWQGSGLSGTGRATQRASNPSDRIAACAYADPSFTIDVPITDGQPHSVAIYMLDWDYGGARQQAVEVYDKVSGALLDRREYTNMVNGVYSVWNISGNVTFKVVLINGAYPNAVVSAVLFQPPIMPLNLLANGGFEAGTLPSNSFAYQPTDQGPWTFGSGGGDTRSGSAFTGGNGPPEGLIAAFIQGVSNISQTFSSDAGTYALYFKTRNRSTDDQQTLGVIIDGNQVFWQPLPHFRGQSVWMPVATQAFTLSAGSHTIQFAGSSTNNDPTVFFDDVRLIPATAAVYNQVLGSFEELQIGDGNQEYAPGGQPWVFSSFAGLTANHSDFDPPTAQQGSQMAFIQPGSYMQQTWNDPGGNYVLSLLAALRTNSGASSTITATLDGSTVGTWTVTQNNLSTLSANVTVSAGTHTLRFDSSATSFIDNVQLAVPVTVTTPGGFNAFESATAAGAITGVIHTKVSGSAFTVDVVSLDTPRTGVLGSFTGAVKVEVLDASDNSGTLGANGCNSSWVAVASAASSVASFVSGDAGRKGFTLTEPEAWRNARLRITTPDTGTPLVQACSTDAFAIRPASFGSLSVSDATSASAGTARSLANTAISGGVVHRAGQPITVQATAINGGGSTTANYAGTPSVALSNCGGAACSAVWTMVADEFSAFYVSIPRTYRFGKGAVWYYVSLGVGVHNCSSSEFGGDPTPGIRKECDVSTLGTLSLTPVAASGVINTVGSYSEVGAFTLQLVDSSFASVDASDGSSASEMNIVSSALDVGRFVPDHFDLQAMASPILKTFDNASCGARSFTYVGQPFGYTSVAQAQVLARNAAGATTQGYAGSLWKLASGGLSQTFGAVPATPALDASGATLPALTSNGDGTGLLVGAGADKLAFTRSGASPIAPFNAAIALTWGAQDASESGVAGNGTIGTTTPLVFSNIGFDAGSQMRFGQIRMVPAYGSELIDLPVLIEAQYWDGQRMATNAADQCTALPMNAVAMGNYQRNLAACKTALGTSPLTLASGRGYIKLKKPGQGNSGSVDLGLQLAGSPTGQNCAAVAGSPAATAAAGLPWLQGRWGNAANYDQNPSTRASFGQYRSPLIYQRESF